VFFLTPKALCAMIELEFRQSVKHSVDAEMNWVL
jgi:hypothetical protein